MDARTVVLVASTLLIARFTSGSRQGRADRVETRLKLVDQGPLGSSVTLAVPLT